LALFSWNAPNAGTVRLKMTVISTNTAMDSCYVNVNTAPTDPYNIWDDLQSTNHTGTPTNIWVEQRQFYDYGTQTTNYSWPVFSGENKFYIAGREPNFYMSNVVIYFTGNEAPLFRVTNLRVKTTYINLP
jgi:hypothetical protein